MKATYKLLTIMAIASLSASCRNTPKQYASVNDYPVYEGNDLGVTYSPKKSTFRLWSPAASEVKLNIYANGENGAPISTYKMNYDKQGTWLCSVDEDLKDKFYTFQIKINNEWKDETPGIWAKAVGVNGNRAAVIDFAETNPDGWNNDVKPILKSFNDIILYEVHVRDFSVSPHSGMKNKGKFLAFTETGTRSPEGESTGIDHLKELGVTHIHLMPAFDYASVDEAKFDTTKYNWGYDPKNYNVPEGSYATDAYTPETRIREFKEMVKALHANGFRVIMDVVYNHTYKNEGSNFDLTAPGYFYRYNADGTWSNASGCHNETASERPMMRKFMIESLKYWATEYHVDGFRFDLMGIHDIETMNAIRAELNKIDTTIFLYGEGWTGGASPLDENLRAVKRNAKQLNGIAVFSDDIRDALKGKWNKPEVGGFVSGIEGNDEAVKFGIAGATQNRQINYVTPYVNSAAQIINYVSCHDDLCLVDKLKESTHASPAELLRFNKLAQTIILTSQGVPFLYAGEEIHRTKKGIHNTYKSPDSVNEINWDNKKKYIDLFNYYKGLIELRKTHPAFRMTKTEDIQLHLNFLLCKKNFIAYALTKHANGDPWRTILVVLNGNHTAVDFELPKRNWIVVCHNGEINLNGIKNVEQKITVEPSSATILYFND